MNGSVNVTEKAPSAWSFEVTRFKELFNTWLDYHVGRFFDISINGPDYRSRRVFVIRLAYIVVGLIVEILLYSLSNLFLGGQSQSTGFQSLVIFVILAFFRLLFILLIPAFIAVELAGDYVADIFELADPGVAWKFIGELSLGGASEVLHIRDGKIAEEDQDSPIVLIGGPGYVEVEFDTAVLFEKPDGTPHVIGPADTNPKILEGFERLREPIINLRDQYIGYTASDAISVKNRSLEGILVNANDIRVVFSVHRGDTMDPQKPGKEKPFLYDPQSIQDVIYQQSVQVLQEDHSSGEPGPWTNMMRGMVSGEIGTFMSQNKLSEFLASISTPEIEAQEYREDTILMQALQYSNQLPDTTPSDVTKPDFHPRTELTDRFMKYTDGFSKRANQRGMDLHWIGVGTWKPSNEVIDIRHLEAWRLNIDNATNSSNEVLERTMEDAYLTEKLRLIKSVPLDAYKECKSNLFEKEKCIEAILQNFWEQMGNVLDFYYANNVQTEEVYKLERAVLKIEKLLNIGGAHLVGGGTLSKVRSRPASHIPENAPPAPASISEDQQYRLLLSKLDGNYKVAEAMIANEHRRYADLTREEAIARIVKRLERYGR